MVESEMADLIISVAATEFQLTEDQRELMRKHQEYFKSELGEISPLSPEARRIFDLSMTKVEGVYGVYILLDYLINNNLERLARGKKQ